MAIVSEPYVAKMFIYQVTVNIYLIEEKEILLACRNNKSVVYMSRFFLVLPFTPNTVLVNIIQGFSMYIKKTGRFRLFSHFI